MAEIHFERDGVELFAVENGPVDARPIILLHGGLANHLACRLFAAPLDARYRVITPDLRGSGGSHFADALTWDSLADDVAALARHLGIERAIIGGVSFGAGVAMRVALRHPALARALVILSPAYGGTELGLSDAQWIAMRAMDAAGSRAPAEGIGVLLPLFDALPHDIRERARALVATYDSASVATSTRFMASGEQPCAASDLRSITAPVLLVPGTDPTHPTSVADAIARNIADCTRCVCEPAGYADAIDEFVRSRLSGASGT